MSQVIKITNIDRTQPIKLKNANTITFSEEKYGYSPYIGENGNWFEFSDEIREFVDTGVQAKGEQGVQGAPGKDGLSPIVSVEEIEGGNRVSIEDINGIKTFDVLDGKSNDGPKNVYTKEEVDCLLKDKMDKIYGDITITGDIAVDCTVEGLVEIENKYFEDEIEIKMVGKNLFDLEYASDLNNWKRVSGGYMSLPIRVPKNTILTTSGDIIPNGNGYYSLISWDEVNGAANSYGWLYHNSQGGLFNTFSRPADSYIYIHVSSGKVPLFLEDFKNLQIEVGEFRTKYMPYVDRSIILDHELTGLSMYEGMTNILVNGESELRIEVKYEKNLPYMIEKLEFKLLSLESDAANLYDSNLDESNELDLGGDVK